MAGWDYREPTFALNVPHPPQGEQQKAPFMNEAYRDLIASRVTGAIAAAKAMAAVTHAGLKGQLRETLIRDLFRPLFPADVGIGTGQIVTGDNQLSPQIDVIIYDRRILPAVLYEGITGLFPLEAVLAVIEVKSTLTATELGTAIASARILSALTYQSGLRDRHTGAVRRHHIERVVPAVFALSTDLAAGGKSELERLKELGGADGDSIRSICVVGRGYWFRIGDQWYPASQPPKGAEVLAFMASISDGISGIASTRHRPSLAHYLFSADDLPIPGRDAIDV